MNRPKKIIVEDVEGEFQIYVVEDVLRHSEEDGKIFTSLVLLSDRNAMPLDGVYSEFAPPPAEKGKEYDQYVRELVDRDMRNIGVYDLARKDLDKAELIIKSVFGVTSWEAALVNFMKKGMQRPPRLMQELDQYTKEKRK